MKAAWIVALVLCCLAEAVLACLSGCQQRKSPPTGGDIAKAAEKKIGSTCWAYSSTHKTGKNTKKCNIFVAEMIEKAGGSVPERHSLIWSPIGAGEWLNPKSTFLTKDPHWKLVTGPLKRGDVVACKDGPNGIHVGIYVGPGTTVSASTIENKVVRNDWGFRPGQKRTVWRYVP